MPDQASCFQLGQNVDDFVQQILRHLKTRFVVSYIQLNTNGIKREREEKGKEGRERERRGEKEREGGEKGRGGEMERREKGGERGR